VSYEFLMHCVLFKGYYKDPNCRYVMAGSGQTKYSFTVMLNSCGTQFVDDFMGSNQAYLENVIVLQNEEGIQEVINILCPNVIVIAIAHFIVDELIVSADFCRCGTRSGQCGVNGKEISSKRLASLSASEHSTRRLSHSAGIPVWPAWIFRYVNHVFRSINPILSSIRASYL